MDAPHSTAPSPMSMTGSNQTKVRDHNERLVLHLIRKNGTLTKAEATRAIQLSPNAVSMIFKSLEKDNLLLRGDPLRGRIGQPSVPLRLNPDARYYIGLKIGRRSFELVVVDFCGAVRAHRARAHAYPTPVSVRAFIKAEMPALLRSAGVKRSQISGSGIAMPTGLWLWVDEFDASAQDMQAWRNFDAQADLPDVLPGPILVENDATAACRAEWTFGKLADRPDSIYFFVGTFIGGGIVLNGSVFTGCHGNAGGFGPIRVPDQPGGNRLIDHASLMALNRMLDASGQHVDPTMFPEGDWNTLEPVLTRWISRASLSLAHAIISTAAVIDFAHVVIDGPFPETVRTRLCKEVDRQLDNLDLQGIFRPEILCGSFGGTARALGAAAKHISVRYMIENPLAPLG